MKVYLHSFFSPIKKNSSNAFFLALYLRLKFTVGMQKRMGIETSSVRIRIMPGCDYRCIVQLHPPGAHQSSSDQVLAMSFDITKCSTHSQTTDNGQTCDDIFDITMATLKNY